MNFDCLGSMDIEFVADRVACSGLLPPTIFGSVRFPEHFLLLFFFGSLTCFPDLSVIVIEISDFYKFVYKQ